MLFWAHLDLVGQGGHTLEGGKGCRQDDFSLNAMLYLMSRTVLNCACGGFCFPALLGMCSNGFV